MKAVTSIFIGAALLASSAAKAAPVTFTFDSGDQGLTSIQKIADGIELTISNFVSGPRSGADSDGIAVYCTGNDWGPCDHFPGLELYLSYEMTFNKNVKLLNYNVSYSSGSNDGSTTYSQGGLSSVQINSSELGIVQFSNQFIAAANLPVQVSTVDVTPGLLQINQFTVEEAAAPAAVPGPLPLIGAATAFGMSRRLRSRIKMGV
jgi:hypothetical protein